jgi:hypothetical protein
MLLVMRMTAALALVILAAPAFAQRASGPRPPGEDWIQLFDGKSLDGWKPVGAEEWKVVDGTIEGRTLTKGYGYLETVKTYKDFQLSVRFKCVGSGNSGVYFHTAFKPGTADVSQGAQAEIDCTINRHTGGIYGFGRAWIVWPSPDKETVVRQNDWNDMLVSIEGNRYRTRLNGVEMIDFTDPQAKFLDGTVALQLHSGGSGHMVFKDIWIRDLTKR